MRFALLPSAWQPTGAKELLSSLKRNIFSTLTPLKQNEISQRAHNTSGDREKQEVTDCLEDTVPSPRQEHAARGSRLPQGPHDHTAQTVFKAPGNNLAEALPHPEAPCHPPLLAGAGWNPLTTKCYIRSKVVHVPK